MEHLLKLKCSHSPLNLRILSSTSVPFTLTTVQVLNLALTHKKRISKLQVLDLHFLSSLVTKPLDKELDPDPDPDPHWDLGLDTQLENNLDPDPH